VAGAVAATVFSAARAGQFWPIAAATGLAGVAWTAVCARRRRSGHAWLGAAALVAAYTVSLLGGVDAVDAWAAGYAALVLLVGEAGHAAAGAPDLEIAEAAVLRHHARTLAVAVLAGFGVAELLLAAAGAGGRGGPEATALGVAAAAAALAVLAVAGRRAAV
jgi:hypothetical protein